MTPQEISKWIREEHEVVDRLSRGLLDRVAVAPRSNLRSWIEETRTALGRFEDHLARHFNLEEEDGYLEAVVERRPTLVLEVDRLRRQHMELGRILTSIRKDIESITEADLLLIEDCCVRVQNMLRYIADHEGRENLIIISVFTNDLGTKD